MNRNGNASSLPNVARTIGDLGPGHLTGAAVGISESTLASVVQNGTVDEQLAAESIRTQTKVNANFVTYPFTITPPFATHPATPVVFAIQILGQNLKRKSLFYQEQQNSGRQANGVTQSGFVLQPGPVTSQQQAGSQGSSLLSQMIQTSFLSAGGTAAIDSPAPTNPVTVIVQYGPPATVGSAITPLVGIVIEGS